MTMHGSKADASFYDFIFSMEKKCGESGMCHWIPELVVSALQSIPCGKTGQHFC